MDPKSRRFLWRVIRAIVQRGQSVVLTSHSMDECEALCARIGIMVNGAFQCLGSSQHLKDRFGDGYTVIIQTTSPNQLEATKSFFARELPAAHLVETCNGRLEYNFALENMPPLSSLFRKLETCRSSLGITDYSVSQTTLDTVFCRFANMQDSDREGENEEAKGSIIARRQHTVLGGAGRSSEA